MRKLMYFDSKYEGKGEVNSGERIVETAGYVSTAVQVQQMLRGGLERGMAKALMYDLARGKDVTDDMYDPAQVAARSYGFDYFAARELSDSLKTHLKTRLKAQKAHDDVVLKSRKEEVVEDPEEVPVKTKSKKAAVEAAE